MRVTKRLLIFFGIFFWGIPIGITFSVITAFLKPPAYNQIQSFRFETFIQNLWIWIPIFIVHGILFGLVMDYFSRKYNP